MGSLYLHGLDQTANGSPLVGVINSGEHVLRSDASPVRLKEFKLVGRRLSSSIDDLARVFIQVGQKPSEFFEFEWNPEEEMDSGGCIPLRADDVIFAFRLRTAAILNISDFLWFWRASGDRIVCGRTSPIDARIAMGGFNDLNGNDGGGGGGGGGSNPISFTCPTDFDVTVVGQTATFSWTPVEGATGYYVFIFANGDCSGNPLDSLFVNNVGSSISYPLDPGAYSAQLYILGDGVSYANTACSCVPFTICGTILVTGTLPDGQVGVAYSGSFDASGGVAPYTYAVTDGALPTGLSLASDGTLSGTPTQSGTSNFTVTATDSIGCTGEASFEIYVYTVYGLGFDLTTGANKCQRLILGVSPLLGETFDRWYMKVHRPADNTGVAIFTMEGYGDGHVYVRLLMNRATNQITVQIEQQDVTGAVYTINVSTVQAYTFPTTYFTVELLRNGADTEVYFDGVLVHTFNNAITLDGAPTNVYLNGYQAALDGAYIIRDLEVTIGGTAWKWRLDDGTGLTLTDLNHAAEATRFGCVGGALPTWAAW